MSTQQSEIGQSVGIAGLPNADPSVSTDAAKSLRRYLWNPFMDINLVGPEGLLIRLGRGRSFYGQGRPGETIEDYQARGGNLLRRCQAYPCDNIQYNETVTNLGRPDVEKFNRGSGNDLGAQSNHEEVTIHAGVCAADMVQQYGIAARSDGEQRGSYGLRDLSPIAGLMEIPIVEELFKIVQPYAYKLTNLQQEEQGRLEDEQTLLFDLANNGPAHERIKAARLDADLNKRADGLRRMMYGGVRDASVKARFDFYDLKKQLANAALGKIGFKSMPSIYDERVCWLLGEAVPSAVARPTQGTDPELSAAVKLLTQHVTGGGMAPQPGNADELAEMKSVLSQMRGERTRLEKLRREMELAGTLPPEGE